VPFPRFGLTITLRQQNRAASPTPGAGHPQRNHALLHGIGDTPLETALATVNFVRHTQAHLAEAERALSRIRPLVAGRRTA
jgi:hypothetical protein